MSASRPVAIITGASRGIGAGLVEAFRGHHQDRRCTRCRRTRSCAAASAGADGEISDIVGAVMYLEAAPFVTGEVLHVDGGQAAGLHAVQAEAS